MPSPDPDQDAPLDPAAERLRRKLVRLLATSFGVMALGLVAVFGAILYRLSASPPQRAAIETQLGTGGTIGAIALSGERLALLLTRSDGGTETVVVDAATGRIIARIRP